MKIVAEYLERAVQLENLAAGEEDERLKFHLEEQARAYRRLADKRARELGQTPPSERKH